MKPNRSTISPALVAILYGVLATSISIGISLNEGIFWVEKSVTVDGTTAIVYPFSQNTSTILDFALLDPLAIFFIFRARRLYKVSYAHFRKPAAITPFHAVGLSILSAAVGIAAMWFYFKAFIGGTFYTESFVPGPLGGAVISATGWAICIATIVALALLFYACAEFVAYLFFLLSLGQDDFTFRLPPTVGDDFKIAIAPCVEVAYVLTTLFAIICLFIFRDFYQFQITNSNRIWWLGPYMLVCAIVFIPFAHLHRLMKRQRDSMIEDGNQEIERNIWANSGDKIERSKLDTSKLIGSIDHIQKLQSFYATIPVWPMNLKDLFLPNASFIISFMTISYKIIDAMKHSP
jgi:hypothetical protein